MRNYQGRCFDEIQWGWLFGYLGVSGGWGAILVAANRVVYFLSGLIVLASLRSCYIFGGYRAELFHYLSWEVGFWGLDARLPP